MQVGKQCTVAYYCSLHCTVQHHQLAALGVYPLIVCVGVFVCV